MAIIYSKEQDGTLNVLLSGKVTREPDLRENAKGNRIKFAISYGKSKFMDVETREDGDVGETASRLEKGDVITVIGTHRSWEYNGKNYQSVSADMIITSTLPLVPASPLVGAVNMAPQEPVMEELDDDETLPF